jgi:hypothetical protein
MDLPAARGSAKGGATRLRISKILADRKQSEGNYSKLEQAIRIAIQADGDRDSNSIDAARAVDRRKLKSIVDNDPKLVLSIAELRGIDQYLERFGFGLAYNPLFEKPEVLRCIAESGHATFLLGSKHDPKDDYRINISHWDVLGLSRIQAGVQRYAENLLLEIREVRMHEEVALARKDLDDPELQRLFSESGPSLLCFGSSRGNQMAERMLCKMADLPPFTDTAPGELRDLPFQFVWPKPADYVLPSQFHIYGEGVTSENQEAGEAVMQKRAACFRHAGGYLIDEVSTEGKREGYTYALCAAQRRESGKIWLLVAGLTGPATYAAARWVNRMPTDFDRDGKPGRPSPVFWNLLRAMATPAMQAKSRIYTVGDAEVVASGAAWGPEGSAS